VNEDGVRLKYVTGAPQTNSLVLRGLASRLMEGVKVVGIHFGLMQGKLGLCLFHPTKEAAGSICMASRIPLYSAPPTAQVNQLAGHNPFAKTPD